MALTSGLRYFFIAESVVLGPLVLYHLVSSADREQLALLTSNRVAWMMMHSGEMLNGVGVVLVVFIVAQALVHDSVTVLELELVLLAHALWCATVLAFWPLIKEAALLHLPLLGAAIYVTWNIVPWPFLGLVLACLVYGELKFYYDVRPNIMDGERPYDESSHLLAPRRKKKKKDRRPEPPPSRDDQV